MDICCRTQKEGESPLGKPKIFLSCCAADFDQYSEKIFKQLFDICDCAVYYYLPNDNISLDEHLFNLSRMNLIVIPVTAELLYTSNRTMDCDVMYAKEHNIPILPLVQEDKLEHAYENLLGHLHFLRDDSGNITSMSYKEKLERFLQTVLIKNDIMDEIHNTFRANIFLSYRQKDRAHALKLMSLIHENELLQDVAIWYDEFLTPGVDYDKNILEILKNSDLFLLAITPSILEIPNYVMDIEYPEANHTIPIIPVELVQTDISKLKKFYPDIAVPVNGYDKSALSQALLKALEGKLSINSDPRHDFLMGMAYFQGVGVEKNYQKAIELLEAAAKKNVAEAAEKLATIYSVENTASADYDKAKFWINQFISIRKAHFETRNDEDSTYEYYLSLSVAAYICEMNFDYATAQDYYRQIIYVACKLCSEFDASRMFLVESYQNISRILETQEDFSQAQLYRKKAVESALYLYENNRNMKVRYCLIDCYSAAAYNNRTLGYIKEAIDYTEKAIEILEIVVKARNDQKLFFDLISHYDDLADDYRQFGYRRKANQYAKKATQTMKKHPVILKSADENTLLEIARYYFKRGKFNRAIEPMEKAVCLTKSRLEEKKTIDVRRLLGCQYSMFGVLWEAKRRPEKAREYYLLSFEIFRDLAEEFPHAQFQYDLVDAYLELASAYDVTLDEPEEALYSDYSVTAKNKRNLEIACGYYGSALELLERMDTDQTLRCFTTRKIEILDAIGRASKVLGKKEEAITCYEEHLLLCAELIESSTSYVDRNLFANACFKLALITLRRDLMEDAYETWDNLSQKYPEDIAVEKKKKEAERLLNK